GPPCSIFTRFCEMPKAAKQSIIWRLNSTSRPGGGRGGQGDRAGAVRGVLEAGFPAAWVWFIRRRAGRGPAFGGLHRSGRRARNRHGAKGRRYFEPSPWLSRRARGNRPACFERDGDQPRHFISNASRDRFDDFRRPHEILAKSGFWGDFRAARQRRWAGWPWPDFGPDFGWGCDFREPATGSRAWPGWRAGEPRRYFGFHLGKTRRPPGRGRGRGTHALWPSSNAGFRRGLDPGGHRGSHQNAAARNAAAGGHAARRGPVRNQ